MSTWMVVEDEPDLYDTLLALFEIWSIDGVAFTNGTDAVKWIEDVDKGEHGYESARTGAARYSSAGRQWP